MRGHVLVEADARGIIALVASEQLSPQWTLRLQRMIDAVVLRRPAFAVLLALLSVRRDHAIGPAQLRQSRLDGRAGGLLGLQEDEFVLVRNDHAARALPSELIVEQLDLARIPTRHDVPCVVVIIIAIGQGRGAKIGLGARKLRAKAQAHVLERDFQILAESLEPPDESYRDVAVD